MLAGGTAGAVPAYGAAQPAHTFDVMSALNPADQWRPPAELAAPVIARLFPHAPGGDPADVLLYCGGRAALGELPRQAQWEWDGTVRT
jgi:hypothetical protein